LVLRDGKIAFDHRIATPRPRQADLKGFSELRRILLEQLGVGIGQD